MERVVRAKLVSLDRSSHTATVQLVNAPGTVLTLPVAADVGEHLLPAGVDLAVLLWSDVGGVVLGPYGAAPAGDPLMPGEYLYIYDNNSYLRRNTTANQFEVATDRSELHLKPDDPAGHLAVTAGAFRPAADTLPNLGTSDKRFATGYLVDLNLTGAATFYKTGAVRRYLSGFKQINYPPDNTYFDLLSFSTPGGATGTTQRGFCSGFVSLYFLGRKITFPTEAMFHAVYFVSVFACSNNALVSYISEHLYQQHRTTLTITRSLREKAGATDTSLLIEALISHVDWYQYCPLYVIYDFSSLSTHACTYITPEMF